MEVIHEGFLERCIHITETKKEWRKGYFVYKKKPGSGSKTFEFFKDSNWKKLEPKGVCNLYSAYTVTIVNKSKKKFMFELITVDKTYELYASSESSRQKWVDLLNDGVKNFNVVLVNSPNNAYDLVKDIKGGSQLQIGESAVTLLSAGVASIAWKFAMIRRYKSQNARFVLEVGRKAPTGEGVFEFDTSNHAELFDVLDKAVKDRIKSKGKEVKGETKPSVPKTVVPPPISCSPQGRSVSEDVPPLEDNYNHLSSILNKNKAVQNEQNNDYDQLKFSDRLVDKRSSEPVLSLFDSTRKITPRTQVSAVVEDDEQYMDMSSAKDEMKQKLDLKLPPRPPPRTTNVGSPVSSPVKPVKELLRKTVSNPITENTYDAPLSPQVKDRRSQPPLVSDEYDQLFENKRNLSNKNISTSPDYSHLNHEMAAQNVRSDTKRNSEDKKVVHNNNGIIITDNHSDSVYDTPKPSSPIITKVQPPTKKVPLKPTRPAPSAPSAVPNRIAASVKNGRKANIPGGSTANNVILKLTRNLESAGFNPTHSPADHPSQPIYDDLSSRTVPDGYNQVGDLIPGEYQGHGEDADGYVQVPNDSIHDGEIYQVPRGE